MASFLGGVNEAAARAFLSKPENNQFPRGLQDHLISELRSPRFIILDDSGSMDERDGYIFQRSQTVPYHYERLETTRWGELGKTVNFFVDFIQQSGSSAEFRFLNDSDSIMLSPDNLQAANKIKDRLKKPPKGGTPLCANIISVAKKIEAMATELKRNGLKAFVVIATDGVSSDGDLLPPLRGLLGLPCHVVIRLCTNKEEDISFWNTIDKDLELPIDVLDDFEGEAKEVQEKNGWLSYGYPLHLAREFGISLPEVDMLDEESLVGDQKRTIAHVIFGGDLETYPQCERENEFKAFVTQKQANEPLVYDVINKRERPWLC